MSSHYTQPGSGAGGYTADNNPDTVASWGYSTAAAPAPAPAAAQGSKWDSYGAPAPAPLAQAAAHPAAAGTAGSYGMPAPPPGALPPPPMYSGSGVGGYQARQQWQPAPSMRGPPPAVGRGAASVTPAWAEAGNVGMLQGAGGPAQSFPPPPARFGEQAMPAQPQQQTHRAPRAAAPRDDIPYLPVVRLFDPQQMRFSETEARSPPGDPPGYSSALERARAARAERKAAEARAAARTVDDIEPSSPVAVDMPVAQAAPAMPVRAEKVGTKRPRGKSASSAGAAGAGGRSAAISNVLSSEGLTLKLRYDAKLQPVVSCKPVGSDAKSGVSMRVPEPFAVSGRHSLDAMKRWFPSAGCRVYLACYAEPGSEKAFLKVMDDLASRNRAAVVDAGDGFVWHVVPPTRETVQSKVVSKTVAKNKGMMLVYGKSAARK